MSYGSHSWSHTACSTPYLYPALTLRPFLPRQSPLFGGDESAAEVQYLHQPRQVCNWARRDAEILSSFVLLPGLGVVEGSAQVIRVRIHEA